MKRYKPTECANFESTMIEWIDGEWVRYEDAISLLGVEIACNCQSEYEQTTGVYNKGIAFYNAWICPAHGYKRV